MWKHMTSQLRTTLQWPPFLFLVVSGSKWKTDPSCSFLTGVRYGTAFSPVGNRMLSSLSAPALLPLKHFGQSKLKSIMNSSSSSSSNLAKVLQWFAKWHAQYANYHYRV